MGREFAMDEFLFAGPSTSRQSRRAAHANRRLPSKPVQSSESSQSTSPSSSSPATPSTCLSCVTQQTSRDDCSYSRFLAWVAVQRNSSPLISSSEKLQCPLMRCGQDFLDHEKMLGHLASCHYLRNREYWCYEHFRVEKFDDMKCRRCISCPSRRRRMLSMAKNFFSTLGHKARRGPDSLLNVDDTVSAPPSYNESQALNPDLPEKPELSSTGSEILEIDSTQVTAAPEAPVPAINPQDLLLPELESVPLQSSMQWQPTPFISSISYDFSAAVPTYESLSAAIPTPPGPSQAPEQTDHAPRNVANSTRSMNLSPSSSVRSTASTASNVSSISTSSSLWSAQSSATGFTSVSMDLFSPVDIFQGEMFGDLIDRCPAGPLDVISELPADTPPLYELSSGGFGPQSLDFHDSLLTFGANPTSADAAHPSVPRLDENNLKSLAIQQSDPGPLESSQSEAKSIVVAAWDALQEHILSSQTKIKDVRNPLADQLGMLPCNTIAQKGLQSLRSILDGRRLASPIETLSLVHMIYSFSLVVYGDNTSQRSNELFAQCLLYSTWFTPTERTQFQEVAKAIWQPNDMTDEQLSKLMSLQTTFNRKGKSLSTGRDTHGVEQVDPLVSAAQNFLDDLEMRAVLCSSFEAHASDLCAKHSPAAGGSTETASVAGIVAALTVIVNTFHGVDGLLAQLTKINQNITRGLVHSTRRFELEALQAGQNCIVPSVYFDSYAPLVRTLFDPIYELDGGTGNLQRKDYHALGISLSEALIQEIEAGPLDDEAVSTIESDHDAFLIEDLMDMDMESQPLLGHSLAQLEMPVISSSHTTDSSTPATDKTPATWTDSSPSSSSSTSTETHSPASASPPQQQAQHQKVEANASCEICGYRPKGDPRWFHGSMAKHKKLQHSTEPPKLYKCNFPGCTSVYKNRQDNLRQHQIEKDHFVDGDEGASRRPSKRKKMAS